MPVSVEASVVSRANQGAEFKVFGPEDEAASPEAIMSDEKKTKKELIAELNSIRRRLAGLQSVEIPGATADDGLRTSEHDFRALTEGSSVGMFLVQDGLVKYANPKMAEIFGYEPAELAEITEIKSLVAQEDWPVVEENLGYVATTTGMSSNCHFRGLRKGGGMLYVAAHGSATNCDGRPAAICSLMDVTSMVEAQARLERELDRFQALHDLLVAMTTERSLAENLALVVDKSKKLFKSDAAFLALQEDAAGDVVMHTLSGINTEAFKRMRIPLGGGLGGDVAATGKGRILHDFVQELELPMQSLVREEGIVSGVAAPIRIGKKNLGVLFIFDRKDTAFSQTDLDTLSLLGNLAAVEITRKRADEAIDESEERYRQVMDTVPDPIVVYMGGKVTYVNPAFTRVFGWTLEEIDARGGAYLAEDPRPETQRMIDQVIRGDGYYGFETKRKNKHGELIDINVSAALLKGREGKVIGSVITLQDITERKRAESQLKEFKERAEDLARKRTAEAAELAEANKKLSLAVKEQEQRATELMHLHQMGELLQACRSERETYKIIGSICNQIFPGDSGYLCIVDESRRSLDLAAQWGDAKAEKTDFGFDACWALRLGKVHCVMNPDVELLCPHITPGGDFVSICTPVTAQGEVLGMLHLRLDPGRLEPNGESRRRLMETRRMLAIRLVEHYALSLVNLRLRETLTRQSIQDPLTGLFNRRYMEASLEREMRRAQRRGHSLGIVMIDVDHFKAFNDAHGHEAGDIILRRLGSFLRKSIRGEDLACRYGGEEFVLILPDASIADVLRRADVIREAAKEELRIHHRGKVFGVTVSLGVASFPEHGSTVEDALAAADKALYQAKGEGRDRVVCAIFQPSPADSIV
jgi:diguanylate cyclase (GGDEF)-like protein/PAS domain S-box-containing protein